MGLSDILHSFPVWLIFLAGTLFYLTRVVVYRLYFHPLADFPGPKLAAATKWYEFYFDVIKRPGGQFSQQVRLLHERYGPIIRINPDEIHVNDPDYYEVLYTGKRDKWPPAATMAGWEVQTFATVEHEKHRQRKAANTPMMARRAVFDSIPMIQDQLVKLSETFSRAAKEGKPLELGVTFLAFTTDVAAQYFFQEPLGFQDDQSKAANWKKSTHSIALGTPVLKQFPGLLKPAFKIPLGIWRVVSPVTAHLIEIQDYMKAMAQRFLAEVDKNPEFKSSQSHGRPSTVFHSIYNNPGPDQNRLLERLYHEGLNVIIAGGETTAKVLTRAAYELIEAPDIRTKVRNELAAAASSAGKTSSELTLSELERLPWLVSQNTVLDDAVLRLIQTAMIKETLRISAIATSRFPLQPHGPLQYGDWTIPAMTPISLTPGDVLKDPSVFANPDQFTPSRWLKTSSDGKVTVHSQLERYFVIFGKGPRMCQGLNLAWAELYLVLATLVSRFDFELFDVVKERDIDYVGDFFLGVVRADSPGVRVTVQGLTD